MPPGQVAGQRLQQRALGLGRLMLSVIEQIDLPHESLMQTDRNVDHGFKASLGAMRQHVSSQRLDRNHPQSIRWG